MSYQSTSSYYSAAPNAQSNHPQYATTGDGTGRSNVYQTSGRSVDDIRQNQYATSSYGWPAQNSGGPVNNSQNTYGNNSWHETSRSTTNYNYPTEAYASSNQPVSNNQPYQSRDPYNSQNTQGLNHLVYASGLEPAVPVQNSRTSQLTTAATHVSSVSGSNQQARTASPANSGSRYTVTPAPQSASVVYSTPSDNYVTSTNSQHLALSAAAALAGAVRNQAMQPSPQTNTSRMGRASNSPRTSSMQPHLQQHSNSANVPSNVHAASQHSRKTSGQTHPMGPITHAHPQAKSPKSTRKLPNPLSHSQSQPSMVTEEAQRLSAPKMPQQQLLGSQNPSIANLVTATSEPEKQVHETIEQQEEMPHYIDPSQVFNPYRIEHERKKREAAEAEARRRIEEERVAEEKRKATEEAARVQTESSRAANSKSKVTKKAQVENKGTGGQNPNQASTSNNEPAMGEEKMAMEMQQMMAKMKEFRSTNPLLFQKLWNDMRGSANAAPPQAMVTPVVTEARHSQVVQAEMSKSAEPAVPSPRSRRRKTDQNASNELPSNGFKVVVENNEEGLPDLGRFPAERRIRQAYGKRTQGEAVEEQQGPMEASAPTSTPAPAPASLPVSRQVQTTPAASSSLARPSPRPTDPNVAWPEPRRRAIAVAAVQSLKANPENASINISAEELCSILERNPSYLDLCTALEARGLRFQRTTFARELLKNVPELQTPTSKASARVEQDINKISAGQQAQSMSPPVATSQSLNIIQHVPPTPTTAQGGPKVPAPSTAIKAEQAKIPSKAPFRPYKPATGPPNRSEPPPGSKAAAARKRDFAELIDLTELDKDENYVLPSKQARYDPPIARDSFRQLGSGMQNGFSPITSEPLRFNPEPQLQSLAQPQPHSQMQTQIQPGMTAPTFQMPHPIYGNYPHPSIMRHPDAPQDKLKTRMVLAKKIDKTEALHKSYYDPKTVARDILIASGRHPSERPLNLHLAGFIGNYIDLDSDVSTFDWDSVDPGGPPPPKVEYVDIPAGPPKFKLGDRVRKRIKLNGNVDNINEAQETRMPIQERYPTRPTSPTAAHSQPHSPATSSRTNLSTKKAHPSIQQKPEIKRIRESDGKEAGSSSIQSSSPARKISVEIPVGTPHRSVRSTSKQITGSQPKMEGDTPLTIRRRGRPPGSKNKQPSVAAMKHLAQVTVSEPQSVEITPEPIMHTYKCKWVKCHAELHNIDTLRRHVLKQHLSDATEASQGQYVCWWKKCKYLEPDGNGNMAPTNTFKTPEQRSSHIEEDHIQPIARKYGDGPKTNNTGKQPPKEFDVSKFLYKPQVKPLTRTVSYLDPQSVQKARERYLSDSNSRTTTPLVTSDGNSDHPFDAMVLVEAHPGGSRSSDKERADTAAQNAFMKAHGNKTKDTKKAAEEVVRAMAVRKAKIGPGLDRGGCTLMNEARRSTFIQAPGISRIVDGEY